MPAPGRTAARLAAAVAAAGLLSCGGGGGGGGACVPSGGEGTPGAYHIDLRFLTALTDAQKAAFQAAAARIEQLVTSNPVSVSVTWSDNALATCGLSSGDVPASETIEGLAIFASVADLGSSGIIAMSGPCLIRSNSHLPLAAVMGFNTAYLGTLSDADLRKVVLHEMLHTLGFGTLWGPPTSSGEFGWNELSAKGQAGDLFTGSNALCAAQVKNGGPSAWTGVPVEDCVRHPTGSCGSGTQDSHWRWTNFSGAQTELMTGWIVPGAEPLSATTVASLRDIGYTVDLSKADDFTITSTSSSVAAAREAVAGGLWLGDDVRRTPPLEVAE